MSFKQIFIEKVKSIYKDSVVETNARDHIENLIVEYFNELKAELTDELEVSSGELAFNYYPGEFLVVILDQRELKFDFESIDINVIVKEIDYQNKKGIEKEIDSLTLSEGKFISRSYSKELDNVLLDQYMKATFAEELDRLLENPAF